MITNFLLNVGKLLVNNEINVEADDKSSKSSPLNRSAITMIILLIGVSIGGVALYLANGKGGFTDNVLRKESLESTLLSRDSGNRYNLPSDANLESAYSFLSPSNQELLSSIPGLVTAQSELTDRISSLSTSIETLTRGLAGFKAEMDTTLFTKFQSLDQQSVNSVDMQAQITLLSKDLQKMGDSVAKLKRQVVFKTKTGSKPIKKKISEPPFTLMSVQIWNSKPVAIVTHQKTKIGVGVNEVLAGWHIDSILVSGCMEVSQKSQSVKLCL
jgi:hypothetical protein